MFGNPINLFLFHRCRIDDSFTCLLIGFVIALLLLMSSYLLLLYALSRFCSLHRFLVFSVPCSSFQDSYLLMSSGALVLLLRTVSGRSALTTSSLRLLLSTTLTLLICLCSHLSHHRILVLLISSGISSSLERVLLASTQQRQSPINALLFGLSNFLLDGIKLFLKATPLTHGF